MLTYLERVPGELGIGPRVAVIATRIWAREMALERCPVGMLRHLFARFCASGALWPAHNFLYWMLVHAARPIDLGCPCCGKVSDDEALMLAALFAEGSSSARAALSELTMPVALNGAVRLARHFGAELAPDRFQSIRGSAS